MTRSDGKSYRDEHTVREKRSPESTRLAARRKAMLACENFDGLHVWHNRRTLPQDAQKARLLTRPTLARLDAPCPNQGRSRRTGRRRTLWGYVEDLFKARTKLEGSFSILLVLDSHSPDARPVPMSVAASARTQSTRCGTGLLWSMNTRPDS